MRSIVLSILLFCCLGCGSVPISQTKLLAPGMDKKQVQQILGEPYITAMYNGYIVWDYHLQYVLNNTYPYRVIFESQNKLVWYGFNNEEYSRTITSLEALKGTSILPNTHQININQQ